MRPEYRFDYRKARPNRFAARLDRDRVVVILDPDISQVFTTSESVNAVLRALIATMPKKGQIENCSQIIGGIVNHSSPGRGRRGAGRTRR